MAETTHIPPKRSHNILILNQINKFNHGQSFAFKVAERMERKEIDTHSDYRGSAYVIVTSVSPKLDELDLSRVFSQYGEITDIHLARQKKQSGSTATAFICYEDQRSSDVAVDNFDGVVLEGHKLRVRHLLNYELPTEYRFVRRNQPVEKSFYKVSGPDGRGFGPERQLNAQEEAFIEAQKTRLQKKDQSNTLSVANERHAASVKSAIFEGEAAWQSVYDKAINDMGAREVKEIKSKLEEVAARKAKLLARKKEKTV